MEEVLRVDNLNYNGFNCFNVSFSKQKFYTIIGSNNSGKTTLFNILTGIIPNNNVKYNQISPTLSQRNKYIKLIGVVGEYQKSSFLFSRVSDEMKYPLHNLKYSSIEINRRINKILKYFDMENILHKHIKNLSVFEKQVLLIMISLLHQPKVLLIDCGLDNLDDEEIRKITNILRKLIKLENLTIINFSRKLLTSLDSDEIILLNNHNIIKKFPPSEIVSNDKILYDNNIEIPFVIDINSKLKMYNLINQDYFDMKDLVDKIWP